jgi:3-oxoacyl-[acyl-carrier-protein] synthase III
MFKMKIIGSGNYLPELVVTNQMMSELVETNDEWITSRTGISERHLSAGEPTWYMASEAARKALANAGINALQVDVILVTTVTPDYYTPSTSCIVQAEIGADKAFCIDLNTACSGFVYALDLASRYLESPDIQHILIISAENLSKITDYSDRTTCVLFGDGASAMLCCRSGADEDSALLATCLGSEGKKGHFLVSRALRVDHPFMKENGQWPDRFGDHQDPNIRMDGQEVFKFAVRVMSDSVLNAIEKAGLVISDLRYIIPHQANIRIVDAAARRIKADPAQIISRMSSFGNTSSASIPICLDELIQGGRLDRGDKVAVCGFGGGLTYGAAVFIY